jgi:hypothetical protein
MQRRPTVRFPLTALAAVLFLIVSFHPTPSDTSIPAPHEMPSPAQGSVRTGELAHWMATGGSSTPPGFHVFRASDLPLDGSAPAHHELGLFTPGPDGEARRRFLERMPYGSAIALAAERHQVDGLLLAAIVAVESGFAPRAVSSQGALGLMQVSRGIGEAYGGRDLLDPYVNVDVGSRYFGSLLADFHGDLEHALAAYNAGPAAVTRYGGVPPYRETRSYVREVMARYSEYSRKAEKAARRRAAQIRGELTSGS